MTVQDYFSLSQDSISIFFSNFLTTFSNIVAAVVIVAVGILIGWILRKIVDVVFEAIGLEKTLTGLPFYSRVVKSHEEASLTSFIGESVRWIAIIVFLIPAVASLQIEGSEAVFAHVFSYITNVVLASLYLLFGLIIAWFIHRVIAAIGAIIGTIPYHLIANVAYIAIVIFASLQALIQLGVTTELIRLSIIAGLAAGALAFGLAGKDTAVDWVKKFSERVTK